VTIVVLDANVWIKERLLRSGMGAALLWAVRKTEGFLLLSDTTRFEIVNGVKKEIIEIAAEIEKNLVTVRALIGQSQEITFPASEEIRPIIDSRLSSLGTLLKETSHKNEHLELALQRVLKHLPPAHKKEEFRDCLLWEMCLDIATSTHDEVVIITEDAAFYQKDKFENGIAYLLREEIERTGANITIFQNISLYLSTLKEEVLKLDLNLVISAINEQVYSTVRASVEKSPHSGIELSESKIDTFLTEVPDDIAIDFRLKYKISELELQEGVMLPEAYGMAEGSAMFNIHRASVSNVQMTGYRIENTEGQTVRQNGYGYMSGIILGGPRYIPYTLRKRI
jgi:hypothetical protein